MFGSRDVGIALGMVLILVIAVGASGTLAWRFAYFIAPFSWTGEPQRLATALGLRTGMVAADIGAGSGALAIEMARLVGAMGRVYATELSDEQRDAIRRRVARASIGNVEVIAAGAAETGLPDLCCEAVYLRMVSHHIADRRRMAASVARALRPGGRAAIVDFAPGALPFHGADHGVLPATVVNAFQAAGMRLRERVDNWGSGMFLLVFEREP